MPKINAKNLIGLPVETQRATLVGKVVDLEVDVEAHVVLKYHVSKSSVIKQLVAHEPDLLVDPAQVVSITKEKMVVVDLEAGETVDAFEEVAGVKKAAEAVPSQTSTASIGPPKR